MDLGTRGFGVPGRARDHAGTRGVDGAPGYVPGPRAAPPRAPAGDRAGVVCSPGPSAVGRRRWRRRLDATCAPPCRRAMCYRALSRAARRVIAIIDGYFEAVPAVWHKEILWALSHGIHVFGASSMGALRAAELARLRHGGRRPHLRGLPRRHVLDDDDEVAVRHAPAEPASRRCPARW